MTRDCSVAITQTSSGGIAEAAQLVGLIPIAVYIAIEVFIAHVFARYTQMRVRALEFVRFTFSLQVGVAWTVASEVFVRAVSAIVVAVAFVVRVDAQAVLAPLKIVKIINYRHKNMMSSR